MPIILLSFPNTSSLILICYVVFLYLYFNFFMYVYGQLPAIKDLLLLLLDICARIFLLLPQQQKHNNFSKIDLAFFKSYFMLTNLVSSR